MLRTCDGDGFYLIGLLNAIAAISLGFVEPEIGLMQYRVNTNLFGTIDHCHAHKGFSRFVNRAACSVLIL